MDWQHHIADTEGRCQRFGEGVDIDYLLRAVDALQRRYRPTVETEFAVVIILDDVAAAFFFSPAQQFIAAADGHDDACGELMRGTDVQDVGAAVFEYVGADALLVHRQIAAENVVSFIDGGKLWVAGVFEGIDMAAS